LTVFNLWQFGDMPQGKLVAAGLAKPVNGLHNNPGHLLRRQRRDVVTEAKRVCDPEDLGNFTSRDTTATDFPAPLPVLGTDLAVGHTVDGLCTHVARHGRPRLVGD